MKEETYPELPALIVDDNIEFIESIVDIFKVNGIDNIEQCHKSDEVMGLLRRKTFSFILLDISMPNKRGDELLPEITEHYPETPVIMLTAETEIETIVNCMKNGATDYIDKPIKNPWRLLNTIKRTLELVEYKKENVHRNKSYFQGKLENPEFFSGIITKSPKMLEIFNYIELIASSPRPVLITGETGTGKELIANAIHKTSRRTGEYIADNAASWDDNLFSDTIFGHEKGAFTDAHESRQGLIEMAKGGTLFLDEIGDVPLRGQVKLLRFLQENDYFTLGGKSKKKSNARIVAATNRDLNEMVKEKEFRKDLYFRFQQHYLHLPPLRGRKEDIPDLVDFFIKKAATELNRPTPTAPDNLNSILSCYHFPGNIRELESMLFDAVSRSKKGTFSIDTIRAKIREHSNEPVPEIPEKLLAEVQFPNEKVMFGSQFPSLLEMKKLYVQEALRRTDDNKTVAADLADIPRTTFVNLAKKVNPPSKEK